MLIALFFTYSITAVFSAVNALRPPSPPGARLPALWLPAMVNQELALPRLILRAGIAWAAWNAGYTTIGVGRLGMWLLLTSIALQAMIVVRNVVAAATLSRMFGVGAATPSGILERLIGRPIRRPEGLEFIEGLPYSDDQTLDILRRADLDAPAPAFLYIHGGGWTGGSPQSAARTTYNHLAERGWVVITPRYPLAPAHPYPANLIAVKRAIAWAKTEGARYGIDPDRIVLAGGSAGAHLAALAALTPDRLEDKPGFETIDVSVAACVVLYGIFDFLNRHNTRPN